MKLLSLLANDNCDFSRIAACIATDPGLSGRLIKRANAGDQPRYCEVRNVLQAAVALGLDRTREVSLAAATSEYARVAFRSEVLRACWHHTLACAIAASELARLSGFRPAEPYTAGLLHDVGRLGLLSACPAEYEEIMTRAESSAHLTGLESECFGLDHVEAGVWLARRWNLPEPLIEAIGSHHSAPAGPPDQVSIIQAACRLADLLGFSVIRPAGNPNLDEAAGALPEWIRSRLEARLPALREVIDAEIRLMETPERREPRAEFREQPEPVPAGATDDTARNLAAVGALAALAGLLLSAAAIFLRR